MKKHIFNFGTIKNKCLFFVLGALLISYTETGFPYSDSEEGFQSSEYHYKNFPYRGGNFYKTEIYQSGEDQWASWVYLGFAPRMQDPQRIKVVISDQGMTVRVTATFTRQEISDYAYYLVQKANEMNQIQTGSMRMKWSDGIYSTPFTPLDLKKWHNYMQIILRKVTPVVGKGYQDNLKLLKSFYPENVFVQKSQSNVSDNVVVHFVFPTTPPAHKNPKMADLMEYSITYFNEYRTWYSREENYVFAGFPALWFNKNVGLHGPIRYASSPVVSDWSDTGDSPPSNILISKRWQLVRKRNSHGCYRMEHIHMLRHLLPSQVYLPSKDDGFSHPQPLAQQVKIILLKGFDKINLETNSQDKIVGVDYYWTSTTYNPDKEKWLAEHYTSEEISQLHTFPYLNPDVIQIEPNKGDNNNINPMALGAQLNRIPINYLAKEHKQLEKKEI